MAIPERDERRKVLVQATVDPADADGTVVFPLGTGLFAVAGGLVWWFRDALAASGNLWWGWVCAVGVIIGVVATGYAHWRSRDRTTRRG